MAGPGAAGDGGAGATPPADGGAGPAGRAAVLVPVKAFARAKVRLAPALAPAERAALARDMASAVLRAAAPLDTYVVCDDDEVARWATDAGATVLWKPGHGLNGAVTDGVAELAATGHARVVVAHADLPHALDLAWLAEGTGVALVPDRRRDGTNVIALPPDCGFTFAYGPGSFGRHRAEADRLGLALTVVSEPRLAWDVDDPDDLVTPEWATTGEACR